MVYKDFHLDSKDGLKLFVRSYLPKSGFHQVLLIVHGFGEHSGRYEDFAKFLCSKQIGVYVYDQRGHGHTEGKRGHTKAYVHYLDDVNTVHKHIYENNGKSVQVSIMGHSMGGNVVSNFVTRYAHDFKKVVLSSPWIELAFEPPAIMLMLARLVKNIYPSFTQPTNLDVDALSKLPEEVKKYKEDPLIHDRITVSTYFGVFEAGKYLLSHPKKIQTETLLLHGQKDKITSFQASEKLAKSNPDYIRFKPFKDGYHELLHDEEKDAFYEEVYGFLNS